MTGPLGLHNLVTIHAVGTYLITSSYHMSGQAAAGALIGKGGNDFTGSFVAQKNVVLLTGTFSQAIAPFSVPGATVKYKSLSDFKGTYDIELSPVSFVGENTVDITFTNDDASVKLPLKGILVSNLKERQIVTGYGTFVLIPTP